MARHLPLILYVPLDLIVDEFPTGNVRTGKDASIAINKVSDVGLTDRAEQGHLRVHIWRLEIFVETYRKQIESQILHPAVIRVIKGICPFFCESFVVNV